jgi:acetoin utilization protein AcuB
LGDIAVIVLINWLCGERCGSDNSWRYARYDCHELLAVRSAEIGGTHVREEPNIRLDIDEVGAANAREEVSRLIVGVACGYTRDGVAATITTDCSNIRELEAEAKRLKAEIDNAVEGARGHYGERVAPRVSKPTHSDGLDPSTTRIGSRLKVRDAMSSDVRTMDQNANLSVAKELMKVGNFRHVIVLGNSGEIAGVISQRDIFYGALAWSMGLGAAGYEKSLANYPAKQVMSTTLVTIDPGADLSEAAELMMRNRVSCLPVVDGAELVGIISDGDFLSLLAHPELSQSSAAG